MKIEQLTDGPADQYTDYKLEPQYLAEYRGISTGYPLLLDIRHPDGQLVFRLHLSHDDVAELVAELPK